MRRILVGVDGSPESRRAADQAAELARPLEAKLLLAYVVSLPAALGPEPIELSGWEIAERAHARDLLEELGGHYQEQGIGIETAMPSGAPAETLAEMAAADDVELVVVGHRGRGSLARVLLGSVADRLVQISPKPVLVNR
jgi:nucleotide-binding universal stress UspA family protein